MCYNFPMNTMNSCTMNDNAMNDNTINDNTMNGTSQETIEHREHRQNKDCAHSPDYGRIAKIAEDAGLSYAEAEARTKYLMKAYGVTLVQVHVYRLCSLPESEVKAFADKMEAKYQSYIDRICEETGWSRAKASAHMDHCFEKYHLFPARYMALSCWKLSDETLDTYLTTADQYALVEKYNDPAYLQYFDSKPLFDETFREFIGRDFWAGGQNYQCSDPENLSFDAFARFIKDKDRVFCKPLSAFGGHGARILDLSSVRTEADQKRLYEKIISAPPVLLEECIRQHPQMSAIYEGSVNSTRITTIYKDGKCHVLFAFTRFGNGDVIDNFSSGGICAAADEKTGQIITPAVNLPGQVFEVHPASGVRFQGFQIPMWEDVLALVDKACRIVPQVAYVGWDVAITSEGPILIEGNTNASMTSYQTCFGLQGIGKRYLIEPYL